MHYADIPGKYTDKLKLHIICLEGKLLSFKKYGKNFKVALK